MDKPPSHQEKKTAPDAGEHSSDYAPYPKIDPGDVEPPPRSTGPEATPSPAAAAATTMPTESNPYVTPSPVPASSSKATMDSVRDVLGKWGKKVGEATKKAEDLAGNVWQHLKTGPSLADTAMGRIAQGTKVIAEGGYEKIFQQTFDTLPEEQLKKSYACYLSTSAGPVMGTLYLSSAKLAFCSDTPLSYKVGDQTEWSYYKDPINGYELGILEYPHSETHYVLVCDKMPSDCHSSKTYLFPEDENSCARMVLIPLHQLRAVNPSTSKVNPSEKYIQIVSIDNHEFWFMGFVNYDSAVKNLQDALHESNFPR